MTKYFQVVPADVLPEVDLYESPCMDEHGHYFKGRFFSKDKKWCSLYKPVKIFHWLRPLPPDTVVVSDLDAVAESVIRTLNKIAVDFMATEYKLPPQRYSAMKDAVKEILKQQDNDK